MQLDEANYISHIGGVLPSIEELISNQQLCIITLNCCNKIQINYVFCYNIIDFFLTRSL